MRSERLHCRQPATDGSSLKRRVLALWLLALTAAFGTAAEPATGRTVIVPEKGAATASLDARAKAQKAALKAAKMLPKFHFADRLEASGIDAMHHGNSVAAADVDGDGRLDLYFTSQLGSNQLWRNRGVGGHGSPTFENWSARAGVGMAAMVSVGAAFADADNDGDPDLFVTTVRDGNVLFENLGDGRFRDVSKRAGLDHRGPASGSIFFDYNGTGRLDLLVTNAESDRSERTWLFENRGDLYFAEVSAARKLDRRGSSGDPTFMDLDRDGFPGVYIPDMQGDDRYHENLGGRSFEDHTSRHFAEVPTSSVGVKSFDFDDDGRLDLLVTRGPSDMSELLPAGEKPPKADMQRTDEQLEGGPGDTFGSVLLRNRGDGRFEAVSARTGLAHDWPMGVSIGDLDADGDQDIFMTQSMSVPLRTMPNVLLLNDQGRRFADAVLVLGIEPRARAQGSWSEIECSGAHAETGSCALGAGSVILDLDGDGDLDIVTIDSNSAPQVLISDLEASRTIDYLQVRLVGTRSNRDGLGASVTVLACDGRRYFRYHDGKTGRRAQSSLPLYFGLPNGLRVEQVEVQWPGGEHQTVSAPIQTRRLLEIVEEAPAPAEPVARWGL